MTRTLACGLAAAFSLAAAGAAPQETVRSVPAPDTTAETNAFYPGNRAPLLPSPLIKLPIGAVRPKGWLRKQLELEADGFTGHLTEISPFCRKQGNAWLSRDGVGANGWEEVPYWFRGFHALGCVLDDARILAESKEWIEAVLASQREDGWFGPRGNLKERGDHDMMPNMTMMFALRAHYERTGDRRVPELLTRYFRWQMQIPDRLFFSGGWQVPRNGDNMDSVYWLYNMTGEPFLLELADKLRRTGRSWMKEPTDGHNVDFAMGFRKPAQFYPQNRDPSFLRQAERNFDSIYGIYGQVPGGMFGGDEFARPGYTDPRQAIETCGIVDMMFSEEILLRITGDAKWADRCENAAYNSLPAAMTADLKALRYLTSPNQVNSDRRSKAPELADGGPMQVMNPHDHRCCQHNSGMGWPFLAESLWHAAPGNGLAATFYSACTVRAKVGDGEDIAIDESTPYPFGGRVDLAFDCPRPVRFPLYLRIPAWCAAPRLEVNGRALPVAPAPCAWLRVDREWNGGDRLSLDLPMAVTVTTWASNRNSVSVQRGPLTFSLKIGERYERYEPAKYRDPWPAWEILPETPWNYGLELDRADPAAGLRVIEKPWPADDMPFTHGGTPVEIRARARKIPNWKEDHLGLVDRLQPSPVKPTAPVETVTLIPMGAARLRISAFPVFGDGPDAHEWQLPPEPLSSYSRGANVDPHEAMFDGKVPAKSFDPAMRRFTTYCFGGAEHGKTHWVRRNLDGETAVSSCEVFWFDETPSNGDVRLPRSWRVLYLDGKEWKEVENASGYGVEPDRFNTVTFKPVRTTALRLEVRCRDTPRRYAMGIYEWRIK